VKATHKNNLNRNIKNYKHIEPEENASSIFDDKFCTRRNHYIKLRKLPNQGRSVFIIVWEDFFQLRIGDVKATIERSKCNPIKGWLKTVPCGCRSKSTKNKSYRNFSTFFLIRQHIDLYVHSGGKSESPPSNKTWWKKMSIRESMTPTYFTPVDILVRPTANFVEEDWRITFVNDKFSIHFIGYVFHIFLNYWPQI
jgi:hypothetical protein